MADGREVDNALTYAVNMMFLQQALNNPAIRGIFISPELVEYFTEKESDKISLISDNPIKHFFQLHNDLYENTEFYKARSNKQQVIPSSCKVSPHALISDDVIVGEDCVFKEGCVVKNAIIGNGVTIKEGAKIGGELSELKMIDDRYVSIRHDALVIIEDDAEIGPNTIVSRGIFGKNTVIGNNARICGGVIIGHRCQIGKSTFIAAGANICGSVIVGNNVWIGPGAISTNGIIIGDGADVTIGSIVVEDVLPGEKVTGNFAIPHFNFMLNWMRSKKRKNKKQSK